MKKRSRTRALFSLCAVVVLTLLMTLLPASAKYAEKVIAYEGAGSFKIAGVAHTPIAWGGPPSRSNNVSVTWTATSDSDTTTIGGADSWSYVAPAGADGYYGFILVGGDGGHNSLASPYPAGGRGGIICGYIKLEAGQGLAVQLGRGGRYDDKDTPDVIGSPAPIAWQRLPDAGAGGNHVNGGGGIGGPRAGGGGGMSSIWFISGTGQDDFIAYAGGGGGASGGSGGTMTNGAAGGMLFLSNSHKPYQPSYTYQAIAADACRGGYQSGGFGDPFDNNLAYGYTLTTYLANATETTAFGPGRCGGGGGGDTSGGLWGSDYGTTATAMWYTYHNNLAAAYRPTPASGNGGVGNQHVGGSAVGFPGNYIDKSGGGGGGWWGGGAGGWRTGGNLGGGGGGSSILILRKDLYPSMVMGLMGEYYSVTQKMLRAVHCADSSGVASFDRLWSNSFLRGRIDNTDPLDPGSSNYGSTGPMDRSNKPRYAKDGCFIIAYIGTSMPAN